MSYCRFGEGDVYVFATTENGRDCICCCACPLDGGDFFSAPSVFLDGPQMLEHLEAHIAAGQDVPEDAMARLRSEIASDRALPGEF